MSRARCPIIAVVLLAFLAIPLGASPPAAREQPISLSFPDPTPVTEIYQSLGKAFEVDFLYDPGLKPKKISFALRQVDFEKALKSLAHAAGHFHKRLDERTFMVADDNPQNRRTYEEAEIQAFYFEHVDANDIMSMIRNLSGIERAVLTSNRGLVARATPERLRELEELIQVADRTAPEVTIDVELLIVPAAHLQRVDSQGSRRLRPGALAGLHRDPGVRRLSHEQLVSIGGSKGRLRMRESVLDRTSDLGPKEELDLELKIRPQIHGSREVTLDVGLGIHHQAIRGGTPTEVTRDMESTFRLSHQETYLLVTQFDTAAFVGRHRPVAKDSSLVLALTPRIRTGSQEVADLGDKRPQQTLGAPSP